MNIKKLTAAALVSAMCLGMTGCGDSGSGGGGDASKDDYSTAEEAAARFAEIYYSEGCGEEYMSLTTPAILEDGLIQIEKWDGEVEDWDEEFAEICEEYTITGRKVDLVKEYEGSAIKTQASGIVSYIKNVYDANLNKNKITAVSKYTVTMAGVDEKGKKFKEQETILVYNYDGEWVVKNNNEAF